MAFVALPCLASILNWQLHQPAVIISTRQLEVAVYGSVVVETVQGSVVIEAVQGVVEVVAVVATPMQMSKMVMPAG